MASTKLLVGFLGIVLAFAPDAALRAYDTRGTRWGLIAARRPDVAGLIMALEQSIVMGIALAWLFVRMLGESEAEDQRARALRRRSGSRSASMRRSPRHTDARAPPGIAATAPSDDRVEHGHARPASVEAHRRRPSASAMFSAIRPEPGLGRAEPGRSRGGSTPNACVSR